MGVNLPVCIRCCFCIPLRYGLLVWAYLKLLLSGYMLTNVYSEWRIIFLYWSSIRMLLPIHASVMTVMTIADISLGITFIVGCHQKNVKLLKIFYIYAIVLIIVQALLEVFYIINTINVYINIDEDHHEVLIFLIIQILISLLLLVLQIYVIILVRSEIIKLNNSYQFQFTNNAAEAECTLKVNNVDSEEEAEHNNMHDVKETKSDEVMKVQVTSHH